MLYENEFSSLNSVAFCKHAPETLAVGSEGGDVYLLDVRNPREFVNSHHCFDSGVHRVVSNKDGYLGVCGRISDVVILDCREAMSVVSTSSCHDGVARGLSWCGSTLYSCGFDKQIIKHEV